MNLFFAGKMKAGTSRSVQLKTMRQVPWACSLLPNSFADQSACPPTEACTLVWSLAQRRNCFRERELCWFRGNLSEITPFQSSFCQVNLLAIRTHRLWKSQICAMGLHVNPILF